MERKKKKNVQILKDTKIQNTWDIQLNCKNKNLLKWGRKI